MDAAVYGALCPKGEERTLAWRLLALAAEREWGLPSLPALAREERGKPWFPRRPDLQFNISHSHGAAVCALHCRAIGVDVECLRPAPPRLAKGMEDRVFFRSWTAREATVKRSGQGLAALLSGMEADALCVTREDFLPGWVVTVCPSEKCLIRWTVIDSLE